MEAVRGEAAVERAVRERMAEVGATGVDLDGWEAAADRVLEGRERSAIAVDREDRSSWPEEVSQREREGALPCPELEPALARALDAGADQADVVGVIHRREPIRVGAATRRVGWRRRRTRRVPAAPAARCRRSAPRPTLETSPGTRARTPRGIWPQAPGCGRWRARPRRGGRPPSHPSERRRG